MRIIDEKTNKKIEIVNPDLKVREKRIVFIIFKIALITFIFHFISANIIYFTSRNGDISFTNSLIVLMLFLCIVSTLIAFYFYKRNYNLSKKIIVGTITFSLLENSFLYANETAINLICIFSNYGFISNF